jgi:2-hydroxy-4-carboxymuconate semialdehyde hemiacetal dehydrogenase
MIRLCMAGEGAMAEQHMQAISGFSDVTVVALVAGDPDDGRAFAQKWQIPMVFADLRDALHASGSDAVILATPSPLHAMQSRTALSAGVHVLVELPMALNLQEAEELADLAERSGRVAMVAHTRRYNAPHRHLYNRIRTGSFSLHHLVVQTLFMRRSNVNMHGKLRNWTDSLVWHHACHTVDLACWLFDDPEIKIQGVQGPLNKTLGIPMDVSVSMRATNGGIVTLALSFNNTGPFGSWFRYIGEEETYSVFRDSLRTASGQEIDLPGEGVALQDREFFDAIHQRREALSSFAASLPSMRALSRLEQCLAQP